MMVPSANGLIAAIRRELALLPMPNDPPWSGWPTRFHILRWWR